MKGMLTGKGFGVVSFLNTVLTGEVLDSSPPRALLIIMAPNLGK